MVEKEKVIDPVSVVRRLIELVNKKDDFGIHNLESETIQSVIVTNNPVLSELCVILYGLRKLISKKHISETPEWRKANTTILKLLNFLLAIDLSMDSEKTKFSLTLIDIQKIIADTDTKLGHYVTHIIDDARLRLASDAYAYGLSAAQASEMFRANKEQLMGFIGITKMPDENMKYKSIKERVRLLEVMSNK
jgi:hypothetical protein